MKIEQIQWKTPNDFEIFNHGYEFNIAHLVMVFGCRNLICQSGLIDSIRKKYPSAHIIGCTTSGEILGTQFFENTITSTAVYFESTTIESASVVVEDSEESYKAGILLAEKFPRHGLKHVFVLSEGLKINGSQLVKGIKSSLPSEVSITGGLAGDDILYEKTMVISNDYPDAHENIVSAIGFYGENIRIGYGSVGGWDSFGIERLITKSNSNILYEMDGKSALELYKTYLGDYAKDLPSSGLLFPLRIRSKDSKEGLVRTISRINEDDKSLTFAGDIPEGYYAKLMLANIDRLVNGAMEAAELSVNSMKSSPSLAILISCLGRKLVLNQRVEEEIEVVREVLGNNCIFTGFYSYGEISPYTEISYSDGKTLLNSSKNCEFNNQTMTITTLMEV